MNRTLSVFLIIAVISLFVGCSTTEILSTSNSERETGTETIKNVVLVEMISGNTIRVVYSTNVYRNVNIIKTDNLKYVEARKPGVYYFSILGPLAIYISTLVKGSEGSQELSGTLARLGGISTVLGFLGIVAGGEQISYPSDETVTGTKEKIFSEKPIANEKVELSYETKSGQKLKLIETNATNYKGQCEYNLPLDDIMAKLKYGETLIVKAKTGSNPIVEGALEINYADLKEAFEKITPPDLYISADFDDGDGYSPDKVLDAIEKSKLKVTVENKGKGIGFDVKLNVQCNEPLVIMSSFSNYLGDIPPNEKKSIEILLQGDETLPTKNIAFVISTEEKNKFDAQRRKIEVRTAKLEKPQLSITNVELNDKPIGLALGNGNGIAENGETIELIASIKNEGVGKAKDANLELDDISNGIEKVQTSERLGDITVGTTVRGKVVISIPRNYTQNQIRYKLIVSEILSVGTGEKAATLDVRQQEATLAFDFIPSTKPLTNNSSSIVQIIPQNKGKLTARNTVLKVTSSSNSNVVLSNSKISVGDIAVGEKTVPQSVVVSLPRTFNENSIPLVIELTQSDFPPYKETKILPVTILTPAVKINADLNRKIRQGETGTFDISISNSGTLDAENVILTIQNESIKFINAKTKNIGKLTVSTTSEAWRLPFTLPRSVLPGPLPINIVATQKDFPSTSLKLNYEVVEESAFVTTIEGKKKADSMFVPFNIAEKPIISVTSHYDKQIVISRPINFRATISAERRIQSATAKINGVLFYDSRTDQSVPRQLKDSKGKILSFENRIADLNDGNNIIAITAYDKENELTEQSITLVYAPEKQITSTNLDLDASIDVEDVDKIRKGIKNPNGIALVIGIEKYQSLPVTLFGDRDAMTMKAYLVKTFGFSEENVVLLTNEDATQSNIRKELRKLANKVIPGVTDVFLFYSGHGIPSKESKAKPYLAPVESEAAYIDETGILIDGIFDNFRDLKARSFTSIIDACFSGLKGGKKDPLLAAKAVNIVIESKGYLIDNGAIFYSSSGDQISTWIGSKRHSVLSYYLFKGLQGEADRNKNSEITLEEIEKYLREKVPSEARLQNIEQTPELITRDKTRVLVKY